MNRGLAAVGLFLGLFLAVPAWGQDQVSYNDKTAKKVVDLDGTIEEETPLGLKLKTKAGLKAIPSDDIVEITYKVEGATRTEFRRPFIAEAKARRAPAAKKVEGLVEALDSFRDLEKLIRDRPAARRYLQYKMAMIQVEIAAADPARVDDAIKALAEYKALHSAGWEVVLALKMLARLQEENGKSDDARKTYEDLGEIPDVPKEIKLESDLLVARLLLRSGKYEGAEKRLNNVAAGLSKDDPQRAYLQVYLADSQMGQGNFAQAEKPLQEAIKLNPDPKLRALAHNLLGDYHRKQNHLEDAFWHYLRVDALYNDDAEEQAKALYYLRDLFDKVKRDPIRAAECARRLQEDRRFAGTVFQKLGSADKK